MDKAMPTARSGGPADLSRDASQPEALIAIAERCEKATGPDRALDYDIAHFVTSAHLANHGKAPAYTASLDAALTLVPDSLFPGVSQSVFHCDWHSWMGDEDGDGPLTRGEANAATPALALCAAALRARATAQNI